MSENVLGHVTWRTLAAERALEGVRPLDEMLRGPGRFGDKGEAATRDAATRLAAVTGRQV